MSWTYQREYIRCGKARCKTCPHGPYWYGYEHRRGHMRKKYFGKADPRGKVEHEEPAHHKHDAVFDRKQCNERICREIMGVSDRAGYEECKRAYRLESMKHHPDRGGEAIAFKRLNTAWSFLKALHKWK